MASGPWSRGPDARRAWIAVLAVAWIAAAALLARGAFVTAAWAGRPADPPGTGITAAAPAVSPEAAISPPLRLDAAGVDAQGIAEAGAVSAAAAYQTGGRLPGGCQPPKWSVVLSASAVSQEQGIQSTAALTSPGGGPDALRDAVAQASACPGTWSQQAAAGPWTLTAVRGSGRSWVIGQQRDWIAVATYLPPADSRLAGEAVQRMLDKASALPGCTGSEMEQVDYYDQQDMSRQRPATYWSARLDPGMPPLPGLPAQAVAEAAPEQETALPADPAEATGSPWPGPSVPAGGTAPDAGAQPFPAPSAIASLAPLIAPEAGGDGVMRGPAPLLVHPDDLPARPQARPPAPGPSPKPPAPLAAQVLVPQVAWDQVGPGCGWAYLGLQAPSPPSEQDALQARGDAYAAAAREQAIAWEQSLAWQGRNAAWQEMDRQLQGWRAYGQARRDTVAAWSDAVAQWSAAEARWAPAASPDTGAAP